MLSPNGNKLFPFAFFATIYSEVPVALTCSRAQQKTICLRGSVVEHHIGNVGVVGSTPTGGFLTST